ncbi:alanine/glycine:cation symporter family protein [Microbulbifer thermotolerans]|uniref:Alanine:cation symporter family protein n=1 Tax=Microbulbifer thermotolerans TaxID=252514 RepID=A0A143HNU1_MICTH|nr:alanine/glycine:cation symporter family protein [Microbulbifer thermotolerans]AMX03404.1 sodium/alanine symporter [Microbulbifer thermotolerans]MCX2778124.1 alanine:cation symporter family protein [Microbulbifer thermotolerans]MCX2783036.1 alanine:cation symporter family protein [Microbulbifer thermotolerans]MCX2795432.1 alanine:cation symporter family protein [Microbulbifer thermotolerans]MCX2802734.1 alanine:cation symporter family protein [Microbulbifer thermotolerans]
MSLLSAIDSALSAFAAFVWGTPLLVLLVGGGLTLLIWSRGRPYRHLGHSIGLLRGKYDDPADPGQVPHRQALSTALSGTLGLGNIAGVAIAISTGGPGAIFWMWVTALVGVATKFYTASLAVMFRGRDASGELQGGPMYVIREGLGKKWMPLAVLFALAGLGGMMPSFQSNQTVQLLRESFAVPLGWVDEGNTLLFDFTVGLVLAAAAAGVIAGRIERIGRFTVRLVPGMVLFYLALTLIVIGYFWQQVPAVFAQIVSDAFTGQAVAGGALGTVIATGISRGAFSNEAGIGTESLAHGAAKTREPIREGVVAMVGPIVDTLVVCTCTALVILLTGVWRNAEGVEGVTMTASAFSEVFGHWGPLLLLMMVLPLAFSTIVTFWYYGLKCFVFLFGGRWQRFYTAFYLALVAIGAVASLNAVNSLIIGMYAIMAIPTMTSTLLLAPHVNRAAHNYFVGMAEKKETRK